MAPSSLASFLAPSSARPIAPRFEKRQGPFPEIPGLGSLVSTLNGVDSTHREVIADLHTARSHFSGLLDRHQQTTRDDGKLTQSLVTPILRSENARNPGLHAIACPDRDRMADILRSIARSNPGQEGHVRFHLGVQGDAHRVAVDAFQHKRGGFTLICMDSLLDDLLACDLADLRNEHADVIKGIMNVPTHNQVHDEGCRIFAVHALNAMHDYQPHFQNLHREIHAAARRGEKAQLADPRWEQEVGTHVPKYELDTFGLMPGKFFKHMQVVKPEKGESRTLLDEAEEKNPALKSQPVNKKGQTLRERFAGLNSDKPINQFSRAERTSSLDRKRLVLIDRAIAHYEGLARTEGPNGNRE